MKIFTLENIRLYGTYYQNQSDCTFMVKNIDFVMKIEVCKSTITCTKTNRIYA